MNKKFFGPLLASVAVIGLSIATPTLAFDAPTLKGAYAVSGGGGAAVVLGKATGGADLNITVNNLTGGDSGAAFAAGLGDNLVVLSVSGDAGAAGIDLLAKDSAKVKLTAGQIKGGWAGSSTALAVDNLDLVIPGLLDLEIK